MNNGLERSEALRKDIAYVMERFDLPPREASGPGKAYAELLTALAKESPPEFICHYYNACTSRTARGANDREKSERDDLGWKELEFYEWRERWFGGVVDARREKRAQRRRRGMVEGGEGSVSGGNRKVVRALGAALAIDRVIDRSIDEKIQRLILILFIFTSCCITMRLRFNTRRASSARHTRRGFAPPGVRIISSFEALSIAAPSAPTMVDVGEMDRVLMGVFGLWMGGGIGMLRSARAAVSTRSNSIRND